MADAVYDKSSRTTRRYRFDQAQRLAVGSASAASAALAAAEVMLHSTTDCFVTVGAAPVADAATNAFPMVAGEKFHLQIAVGEKVAAVRATADGFLYILPVDGRAF